MWTVRVACGPKRSINGKKGPRGRKGITKDPTIWRGPVPGRRIHCSSSFFYAHFACGHFFFATPFVCDLPVSGRRRETFSFLLKIRKKIQWANCIGAIAPRNLTPPHRPDIAFIPAHAQPRHIPQRQNWKKKRDTVKRERGKKAYTFLSRQKKETHRRVCESVACVRVIKWINNRLLLMGQRSWP